MSIHVLENEELRIEVADAGAELVSVTDKKSNRERLWTADPAIWNRHSPILFPFVGRVTDGKYRVNGKEYSMKTQHGFARDLDFVCVAETEKAVTHCLMATEQTKAIYPYDFRLTVQHCLSTENPRQIVINWEIRNTGKEKMYYSVGGHPGFLLPEDVKKEDCYLVFPGRERLRYFGANSAGFALPQDTHELKPDGGYAKYQADIPDTWIFEDQQIDTVGIALPDRTPYVTMKCGQFPMLAIWANPRGTFICLEPWFGRTDDDGFTGSLDEKKGMETLDSGETRKISYSVEFHRV